MEEFSLSSPHMATPDIPSTKAQILFLQHNNKQLALTRMGETEILCKTWIIFTPNIYLLVKKATYSQFHLSPTELHCLST